MSNDKDKPHCYIDHANKKSENYAANPYLFWLNQARRRNALAAERVDDSECRNAAPADKRKDVRKSGS